jgi:hypothetical protein
VLFFATQFKIIVFAWIVFVFMYYILSLSKNAVLLFRSRTLILYIGYRGQHPSTLQSALKSIYIQFSYSLNSVHWYYSIACIICIKDIKSRRQKIFKRCRWPCMQYWLATLRERFDVHIIISSINIYLKTPGFRSMSKFQINFN